MKYLKYIFCGVAIGVSALYGLKAGAPVKAEADIKPEITATPTEAVLELPEVPAILLRIAECESNNRQFNEDGSVLRGRKNPSDVGRFQINEFYHLETARKLNMDIYTWEDNTAYALYLFEKNGTRDWLWSASCWQS